MAAISLWYKLAEKSGVSCLISCCCFNDLCKYGIADLLKTPTFAIEELKRTQDRLSDMQNPR